MRPLPATVVRGAIAGALGTVTMSGLMLAAQRAGLFGRQPPELLTEAALDEADVEPVSDVAEDVASTLAHFGAGATFGVAFAVADRALGHRGPGVLSGPVFGLGVWALSYKGVIPALGVLPPPEHDNPGRAATMAAAHVVWGATTASVLRHGLPA